METGRGRGRPRDPTLNETVKRLWPLVLGREIGRDDVARRLNISPQRVSMIAKQNGLDPLPKGPRVFWGNRETKISTEGENDGTRTRTTPERRSAAD